MSENRSDGEAAYVLHTRPYRDSSLLVDFLTLEHGKMSTVVRGARRPNSRYRATLQPFSPLMISWQGRQELKTLKVAEPVDATVLLTGKNLLCGLYLNELLSRLLSPFESFPKLYLYYQYVLNELRSGEDIEGALRTFEQQLLRELGYWPDLTAAEIGQYYAYHVKNGLRPVAPGTRQAYSGEMLQAIEQSDFSDGLNRRAAKVFMRTALDGLLGDRPLRSRELFQNMRKKA